MKNFTRSFLLIFLFSSICLFAQENADGVSGDMTSDAVSEIQPDNTADSVNDNTSDMTFDETDMGSDSVNDITSDLQPDKAAGSVTDDSSDMSSENTDITADDNSSVIDSGDMTDVSNDVNAENDGNIPSDGLNDDAAAGDSGIVTDNGDGSQKGDDLYDSIDSDNADVTVQIPEEQKPELKTAYGRVIFVDASEIVLKLGKKEYYFTCLKDMTGRLEICQTAEIYYYEKDDVMIADGYKILKESSCYSEK